MFAPSKTGLKGYWPTFTVWSTLPAESSLTSVPARLSATQMLDPSKRIPRGEDAPAAMFLLVGLHGVFASGVTKETVVSLALQIRVPSKARPPGPVRIPRLVATVAI